MRIAFTPPIGRLLGAPLEGPDKADPSSAPSPTLHASFTPAPMRGEAEHPMFGSKDPHKEAS